MPDVRSQEEENIERYKFSKERVHLFKNLKYFQH